MMRKQEDGEWKDKKIERYDSEEENKRRQK